MSIFHNTNVTISYIIEAQVHYAHTTHIHIDNMHLCWTVNPQYLASPPWPWTMHWCTPLNQISWLFGLTRVKFVINKKICPSPDPDRNTWYLNNPGNLRLISSGSVNCQSQLQLLDPPSTLTKAKSYSKWFHYGIVHSRIILLFSMLSKSKPNKRFVVTLLPPIQIQTITYHMP